jgi:hypothetical protein
MDLRLTLDRQIEALSTQDGERTIDAGKAREFTRPLDQCAGHPPIEFSC